VVDDASQDNTIKILQNLSDPRVRLYRNANNRGVIASFERAMRLAYGDILFLSDQDDLWLPGKVNTITEVFNTKTEITLVVSDAKVIDKDGIVVADSFFSQRGRFTAGIVHNLLKNKYLGCTLAFRKTMLPYILPIPQDVPMHDMWIGLINTLYGQTQYISQPLIAYRRHESNLSPSGGTPIIQKIVWRWYLVKNLFVRASGNYLNRQH
jgi:glycosyltransferase involved in cell wall biosynthesis